MQETLYPRAYARDYIRQRMQDPLYQTADEGVSISNSGCNRLYNSQRMQETLYYTADARDSISNSRCKRLYQIANAGVSI